MSLFFLRFFLLILFVVIFLVTEFRHRKRENLHPQSLGELFNMGAKWKQGSDPRISALLFAVSTFAGFVLWESVILTALNVYPMLGWTLPVGLVLVVLLLRERSKFHPWTFGECLQLYASIGLIGGALFCWVLFPWLYIRSLFLKKDAKSNKL